MTITPTRRLGAMISVAAAIGLGAAAPAHAEVFITCPSGRDGIATTVTSCAFADNVRYAWFHQDGQIITAYSPVTAMFYTMYCNPHHTAQMDNGIVVDSIRCEGGNNAVVVIW